MKSLSYHIGLVRESITNDKNKIDLYAKIDMHRKGLWKPSKELAELSWIQGKNFSSTAPADTIDAGARAFATLMPKISILPTQEDSVGYEDAERKETALDWHYRRMNMWGGKTTHWRILESAMRYCAVAFETEYLPYKFKGKSLGKREKAILSGSAQRWTVHHPSSVHPYYSNYGMECVTLDKEVCFYDLVTEFGEDNKGVLELKEKLWKNKPTMGEMVSKKVWFYKTTDWDERCIFASINPITSGSNTKDCYVLMKEEHGLDFIPFVVTDNEDPLLKNAINTGLLDNLNNLRLMSFSSAVTLVASSQKLIQTPDGTLRNVHIDNTNPQQPMVTDLTAKVTSLAQDRPNDAIENKVEQATQEVYTTTVAQILSDANKLAGTEAFSTANLAFNIALSQLSLARDAAERAIGAGLYQTFQWIDHASTEPLIAFREKTKEFQGVQKKMGQEIVIKKGEFDTRYLYIDVKLREFQSLDEQAKWNLAITQVERLGMSRQIVAEENGVENYSIHEMKRTAEDLMLARVQAETSKIIEAAKMEILQAQQAMQPQPTAPNDVNQMNASYPVAEGADMRGGSMPSQPSNPMETQQTIQGNAGGIGL